MGSKTVGAFVVKFYIFFLTIRTRAEKAALNSIVVEKFYFLLKINKIDRFSSIIGRKPQSI